VHLIARRIAQNDPRPSGFVDPTASAMSLTFQSQKPATNSFVSAKGPSMRVRLGPSKATRLPFDEGCKPPNSPAKRMPALTSSSFYLPMASSSSVEGMMPASLSFVAFTRTITRIASLLAWPWANAENAESNGERDPAYQSRRRQPFGRCIAQGRAEVGRIHHGRVCKPAVRLTPGGVKNFRQ
jgi:hypothetical protein